MTLVTKITAPQVHNNWPCFQTINNSIDMQAIIK